MSGFAPDSPVIEPNVELLRVEGWQIISASGPYCTVWKGGQEVVLVWRDGAWERLAG